MLERQRNYMCKWKVSMPRSLTGHLHKKIKSKKVQKWNLIEHHRLPNRFPRFTVPCGILNNFTTTKFIIKEFMDCFRYKDKSMHGGTFFPECSTKVGVESSNNLWRR